MGRRNLGHLPAQDVHEIVPSVLVSLDQGFQLLLGIRILDLLRMEEGQGMGLHHIRDDELDAGQADPLYGKPPPAEGRRRVGDVHEEAGTDFRQGGEIHLLFTEFQDAGVDLSLVPFGAGHGDLFPVLQDPGGVFRSHYGRNAQLPAHDGGVAGPASMVRHHGSRALQDGPPVRVRSFRDQHGAFLEAIDLLGGAQHGHGSGANHAAHGSPGDPDLPFLFQAEGLQCPGGLPGLDGLWPGLKDEQLPRVSVLPPLHVHGPLVVLLDGTAPPGQPQDLLVRKDEGLSFLLPRLHGGDPSLVLVVDDLLPFPPFLFLHDGNQILVVQEGLEHQEAIGVHRSLHHRFSESPGGVDEDHPGKARIGIQGEEDPGSSPVGPDHLLDSRRESHLHVVESLFLTVRDGPVREERSVAAQAGKEDLVLSHHVQITLLLAGEGRFRQVLGGCAASDGHVRVRFPVTLRKLPVCLADGFLHRSGKLGLQDHLPDLFSDVCHPTILERSKLSGNLLSQTRLLQKQAVGARRGGEPSRHPNALLPKGSDHFAQGSVLATHLGNVLIRQILQPSNTGIARVGHRTLSFPPGACLFAVPGNKGYFPGRDRHRDAGS